MKLILTALITLSALNASAYTFDDVLSGKVPGINQGVAQEVFPGLNLSDLFSKPKSRSACDQKMIVCSQVQDALQTEELSASIRGVQTKRLKTLRKLDGLCGMLVEELYETGTCH